MKTVIKVRWLPGIVASLLAVGNGCHGVQAELRIVNDLTCKVPDRNVTVEDNSIVVSYNFSEISKISAGENLDSAYFALPGFGFCNETGKPKLPMRVDSFVIPDGMTATISCSADNEQIVSCEMIGVEDPGDEGIENSGNLSQMLLPYNGFYPAQSAQLLYEYILRGKNVTEILVSPVQYNNETGEARIYENITYRISFSPSVSDDDESIFPDYTAYLKGFINQILISNPTNIGRVEMSSDYDGVEGYLIVTTNKYLEPVESFEYWKKELGFTTHILSQPSWDNYIQVKEAIRDYVDNHANVRYLLIVGDLEDVPAEFVDPKEEGIKNYVHSTDLYYGLNDENSFIPDFYIGRIPVNNKDEARDVLSKIVNLEMCPISEPSYYSNAFHCAYYQIFGNNTEYEHRRFIKTSEEVRDYVQSKGKNVYRLYNKDPNANPKYYNNTIYGIGEALPPDLVTGFSWHYPATNVVKKFNSPNLYCLYRGHGSKNGLVDKNGSIYWLNISNLGDIKSTGYPTTLFSITCQTGIIDDNNSTKGPYYYSGECLAEEMLKIPDGGASTVIAATHNSKSGYNDALVDGMFDAIWPNPGLIPKFGEINTNVNIVSEPTYRLGPILAQGLFRMNEQYGTIDKAKVRYEYEIFHLYGDPSLDFFTEVPTQQANVQIKRSANWIQVINTDKTACVGLFNKDTGDCRRFDGRGGFFYDENADGYVATITAHNKLPKIQGFNMADEGNTNTRARIYSCDSKNNNCVELKITNPSNSDCQVSVLDVNGRPLYSSAELNQDSIHSIDVILGESPGVYIVVLQEGGVIADTKKIIK